MTTYKTLTLTLTAAAFVLTAGVTKDATAKNGPKDIYSVVDLAVEINADSGEFSTLIAALQAVGLDGRGQYTVFAPTDQAFADIGLDADSVVGLPEEALTNILLYHVAQGRRDANAVVKSKQIRMLNKEFADVTPIGDGVLIDDALVVGPDNLADNGIVHVTDLVLLP